MSKQIIISSRVMKDIHSMMKKWKDIEWFGFLYGNKTKNKYYVNKLYIPKMEKQTPIWVETEYVLILPNLPGDDKNYFLGYIHSHHSMGAYFSQHDLLQFRQVDFAMVVAWKNVVAGEKINDKIIMFDQKDIIGFKQFGGFDEIEIS